MKYYVPGYTYFEIMSDQTRKEAVFIHNNFLLGKSEKMKRFRWFNFLAPSLDSSMRIAHTAHKVLLVTINYPFDFIFRKLLQK